MTAMVSDHPPPAALSPRDDDVDDVRWAISTATAQWQRGGQADAIVWIRRAAIAAEQAGLARRAVELRAFAATLTESMWGSDDDEASRHSELDVEIDIELESGHPAVAAPRAAFVSAPQLEVTEEDLESAVASVSTDQFDAQRVRQLLQQQAASSSDSGGCQPPAERRGAAMFQSQSSHSRATFTLPDSSDALAESFQHHRAAGDSELTLVASDDYVADIEASASHPDTTGLGDESAWDFHAAEASDVLDSRGLGTDGPVPSSQPPTSSVRGFQLVADPGPTDPQLAQAAEVDDEERATGEYSPSADLLPESASRFDDIDALDLIDAPSVRSGAAVNVELSPQELQPIERALAFRKSDAPGPGENEASSSAVTYSSLLPPDIQDSRDTGAATRVEPGERPSLHVVPSDPPGGGTSDPPHSAPPVAQPSSRPTQRPPSTVIDGVALAEVSGFEDLPESVQQELAASARLVKLEQGEEVLSFGAAVVTSGQVNVLPAAANEVGTTLAGGQVLFTHGTMPNPLSLRVVAKVDGTRVALWQKQQLEDSLADFPWVEDDLCFVADRYLALCGATLGPLGQHLDSSIRDAVFQRLEVKTFEPGEVIMAEGEPPPGLFVVAGGEVEALNAEEVAHRFAMGDFVFASAIMGGTSAPNTVRAGQSGALTLFAPRAVAHELMVIVPPLLEAMAMY
jgi:hypothetical protein